MSIPYDPAVTCPGCSANFKLSEGLRAADYKAFAALVSAIGPDWRAMQPYLSCFRSAQGKGVKPERMLLILEELAEIKKLEAGLGSFCEAERKREDFKSRALYFGSVFFRQRTGLSLLKKWTWKKAAEMAQALGLREYLQVSYEIKRDELRQSDLTAEQLAQVGVARYTERPFTYELDEERFERVDTTESRPGSAPAA